jgi:isobutyryl-CoA mutase
MKENLPGDYPYTGGVYPYRRTNEDPIRMFAGEGTPERTNRRFHYVSEGQPAKRLSTAFDSVTLYGEDPAERPDIYGKVGNSGVSIATLDDMKKLYSGFDLAAPDHLGVDDHQRPGADADGDVHEHRRRPAGREVPEGNRQWDEEKKKAEPARTDDVPGLHRRHAEDQRRPGLGMLGITGDQLVDARPTRRSRPTP